MDAAGIFDAGTDPAYFARMTDQLRLLGSGDGGQNQGGANGGGGGGGANLLGGAGSANGGGNINLSGNRWINPVGGSSPNNGDPASVSWSIVPDGTQVSTINGGLAPSNFISFMDGIYGASPGPVASRPWFNLVRRTYENWASVSGLNFIYEPNDDGAAYGAASRGVIGVRGDMRVGGAAVDGNSGILAYAFYPTGSGNSGTDGDMVVDTSDNFYSLSSDGATGENRGLHNVLSHEIGHGIGLGHVIPTDQTKLMEPFVSFAYYGAQHDDILATQTLYGDTYEQNDSTSQASNLGLLGNGVNQYDNLSIDRSEDTDVYLFTVGSAKLKRVTLIPVGKQYDVGPQGGQPTTVNTLVNRNLSVQIERLNGEVVAVANSSPAGLPEILQSPNLTPGAYFLRVLAGAAGETQMYSLKFEAYAKTSTGPILIGVQPNNSELIENGSVRTVSPRELTFRFDDAQIIDPATVSGIRVTRAGGDGSFGLPSVSTDFGTNGKVDVQLTARNATDSLRINVTRADLGIGAPPQLSISGDVISVVLNSRSGSTVTAKQLVDFVNSPSSPVASKLSAKINGGFAATPLGLTDPSTYSPIVLAKSNDVIINPGAVIVGDNPNENEVTLRFAENLPDDNYRIEVYGFDDTLRGITGLRNVTGDLFVPRDANTRQDTLEFRLDLGSKVTAVVPQPVVRNTSGVLEQRRDTIVVYFDNEKLFVENDSLGNPTAGSSENPDFYQLLYTANTVRNTDDITFKPERVTYNASANTATLRFSSDIDLLPGPFIPSSSFRLRIGTRETTPIAPVRNEAAATAISDLNTNAAVKLRFTAKTLGESGSGLQISFVNSLSGGTPTVSNVGGVIVVDMARADVTANEIADAMNTSTVSSPLMTVTLEPGSNGNTVVGNRVINYSPIALVGLGSSFDTSTNLGTIGSKDVPLTSLLLTSNIDPEVHALDLIGANNDPGTRNVPEAFENYINPAFTGDNSQGIRTIYYNFKDAYGTVAGTNQSNAITDKQKARIREAFSLWSEYVGVQFVETPDSGFTMALGALAALPSGGLTVENAASGGWGVRIDPAYQNSLAVFSADNTWNDNYGENFTRCAMASIGMLLGLARAGDADPSTLMNFNSGFLNFPTSSNRDFEPVFPGNLDVLRANFLHRPESSDIDLYKFDVDFGPNGQTRQGSLVVESLAERLASSSPLDTRLALYKQTQATAVSNLGAGGGIEVKFTAVEPGKLGNNLLVFVTRSNRGVGAQPIVNTFPNAISIDLNSTVGSESTLEEFLRALDNDPAARGLVKVELVKGDKTTKVGNRDITYSPIILAGGNVNLIAQNDDYFGKDSLIRMQLDSGVYFIGISASGNDKYDASVPGTGNGGRTQGRYDLRVTFRAQTDGTDSLQDVDNGSSDVKATFDGDGDGVPGGTYNYWFETRPLDRVLRFNSGGNAALDTRIVTITGGNGTVRRFEFSLDPIVGVGNTAVIFNSNSTAGDLASALANAINSRSELGVTAVPNGTRITLKGERLVQLSNGLTAIDLSGKTIFVDKSAGPNADGSLTKPFNNISGSGVANAFAASVPGDIIRIVGNGGADGKLETVGDNFAYEVGFGVLAGSVLSDGSTMDVPKGVSVMVDAGAVFKMRRSRIGVGSSTLGVDRSGGALQVLGTPKLLDRNGNAIKSADGSEITGSVFFTSWLDQSIGLDNYAPNTTPTPGDWGGLVFKRDLDRSAGRFDLEDEGIFRQYVNYADMRYGGSSSVVIDSVQQTVNSIQIADMRPTVTFNRITNAADSAMSATPDSFEETLFSDNRYQRKGSFTPDYDRIGPAIHDNTLINNSINGLFIKVSTPAGGELKQLTVPGRFNDTDIVHVISENIVVSGNPGGGLLDSTIAPSNLISLAPSLGGSLTPGDYQYKLTFVDKNGYETPPSEATPRLTLTGGQTAVRFIGLPGVSGEYVSRRLYRADSVGGPYRLVAELDGTSTTYTDRGGLLTDSSDALASLLRDRPVVSSVGVNAIAGGTLPIGSFNYKVVMIDAMGRESLASNATASATTTPAVGAIPANRSIRLTSLPSVQSGYVGRRIYRSSVGGAGTYTLIADLRDPAITSIVDNGTSLVGTLSVETSGNVRPRLDASLAMDPGLIVKLEGARIELGHSTQLLAEGVDGGRIVLTSKQDDRFGAGGTFDTNNNGLNNSLDAKQQDWSGIFASPGANVSLDNAVVAYAGGISRLEGTFKAFSPLELQQADARIANTVFENNGNGMGGQGPIDRLGRPANENYPFGNNASRGSTVFVRGTQPIFLNNTFQNNTGTAITIDANSMDAQLRGDLGRQTGNVDRNKTLDWNRGPLFRGNRLFNNSINGIEIRADASTNDRSEDNLAVRDLQHNTLTTDSVWDDTDIVHVLFDSVTVGNLQQVGGLRLQSAVNESLVIKMEGQGSNFDQERGTGFTATGNFSSITDRVGGTVQVLGMPGFPVVITSLRDDTVGAGTQPDGRPQTDTNNDGIASIPRAGDWRSLLFDSFSNDRNVATALETESPTIVAPGINDSVLSAQFLGALAPDTSTTDENLVLGFTVQGVLSESADQDLYSFSGTAGTEVWFDVDYTQDTLDSVIEILNANGDLLARSDDSTAEQTNPSLLFKDPSINPDYVNPIVQRTRSTARRNASGLLKEDGTSNPKDAGLRVLLPGLAGAQSTYFFRIRSKSTNIDNPSAGITAGSYTVQVRLRDQQEFGGSTVQYADIRYATNGVQINGLPNNSPLTGEANSAMYDGTTTDGITDLGPLQLTNKGAISVAGTLSGGTNRYRFTVGDLTSEYVKTPSFASSYPVVIDVDYADGLNRKRLNIQVLLDDDNDPTTPGVPVTPTTRTRSSIVDDLPGPLSGSDLIDLTRGSVGTGDPFLSFLGTDQLRRGTYEVVVTDAEPASTKAGVYQMEIRTGDRLSSLPRNFRGSYSTTVEFLAGLTIADRSTVDVTDGANRVTLEWTRTGAVNFGNIPILYSAADSPARLGDKFRDIINQLFQQKQLNVRAADSNRLVTGNGNGVIDLFGNVEVIDASNIFTVAGTSGIQRFDGTSDQNIARDQGQFIVSNNLITKSRDYAVWSAPADKYYADGRAQQARLSATGTTNLTLPPTLGGAYTRNLPVANKVPFGVAPGSVAERAGVTPGIVVTNNIFDESGLGGLNIQGETPTWRITVQPGSQDTIGAINTIGTHAGSRFNDAIPNQLEVGLGRTRVRFEFEDIAGAGVGDPTYGSGIVGGNGWSPDYIPIYYREDTAGQYLRANTEGPGYAADEMVKSIRDSFYGSVLTTNGTTQRISTWIEPQTQVIVRDPDAPDTWTYPSATLVVRGPQYIVSVNTPVQIQRVGDYSASPFVRAVNNTFIGNDGRAPSAAVSTDIDGNDTIAGAAETFQGVGINPQQYSVNGSLSPDPLSTGSSDVDLYKFQLEVGERVRINVNTAGRLDAALKVFDASGVAQIVSNGNDATTADNVAAPGETLSKDPYIDFTATKPGVYYAAVSAAGNTTYDPLSLADRRQGATSGDYTMTLEVLKPEQFVITVDEVNTYADGETFTIRQVSDFIGTSNNSRTFEFTTTGATSGNNIPVFIGAEYRVPDLARSIAAAINGAGMTNAQNLNNGAFGFANPLAPVSALPLGGISGFNPTASGAAGADLGINSGNIRGAQIEAGLNRTANATNDRSPFDQGNSPGSNHMALGFGHDRTMSGGFGTALGDGTTEKFVVVRNAYSITSSVARRINGRVGSNNANQIIPESGISISSGATPTLMNNAFINVQSPIVQEPPTYVGTIVGAVNPARPAAVVVGGNTYQYVEPAKPDSNLTWGNIEAVPTNVPNTSSDFNFIASDTEKLLVDFPGNNFLPGSGSQIIDSSINSLPERESFRAVKSAVGIAPSPILAPDRDYYGIFRADDPNVAPPSGLGGNVFKDRGAVDRADFVGPTAVSLLPIDNDAQQVDSDKTVSVIQLTGGVYPEFRIQLKDGFETANLGGGTGINDDSVIGRTGGNRLPGSAVTITENGRLLIEGIDYAFSYNTTTNEIVLKPLAGVWRNQRVYDININNKDRFVVNANSGDQINDGDSFSIKDSNGGNVTFEYESGYRLQIPQGLQLNLPLAGGGAGGILDGDRFTINSGSATYAFEFDSNANVINPAARVVRFTSLSTKQQVVESLIAAINSPAIPGVVASLTSDGYIFIGAPIGTTIDTESAPSIQQPNPTIGLLVPSLGTRPGGITDGQTFSITDGRVAVVFEYDSDGTTQPGNVLVDISQANSDRDVATATQLAIAGSTLALRSSVVNGNVIHLSLPTAGRVDVVSTELNIVGVARTIQDGQTITITRNIAGSIVSTTFEFTTDASFTAGNIPVIFGPTDTQSQIGEALASAIASAGLGLSPQHVGNGNVIIGGSSDYSISVANAPTVGLFGQPGVQGRTTIEIFGTLLLQVPARGGADLVDNTSFTITNRNLTAIFEFDGNFSGSTIPGSRTIRFGGTSTQNDVVNAMIAAINGFPGLGVTARDAGNGRVDIGLLPTSAVNVQDSKLTTARGNAQDGDYFSITDGVKTVTFEFENLSVGNGRDPSRVPIRYTNQDSVQRVYEAMKATIKSSVLNLDSQITSTGLELFDTAKYLTNVDNAPSLRRTGVPGGAIPVLFIQDPSFTAINMRDAIIRAINGLSAAGGTSLVAKVRGGSTLFVENAVSISPELSSFFLRGVQDNAGNFLQSNRIDNETKFTIIMPGVELDYGDAPDPFTTTLGRYPTLKANDGARHVVSNSSLYLGAGITSESDGKPQPLGDGDENDDGVSFRFQANSFTGTQTPMFNKNIDTELTVTMSAPGVLNGWIDFNFDGDWADPGENVFDNVVFSSGSLTQTLKVRVPATAPNVTLATSSFARFRASTAGSLTPTGLALDGEVEDYRVSIVPGTPPVGVNDTYTMNEDQFGGLVTNDPFDSDGFPGNNGVLANDINPDRKPLSARLVTPPTNALVFQFRADGTFDYIPNPDYFGQDSFVYVVTDGVLDSLLPATALINVRPVNDPPIAGNLNYSINEDQRLDIPGSVVIAASVPGPANESDQTLTILSVDALSARGGSVRFVAGLITYIPLANFVGNDSFTYTIIDNGITGNLLDPLTAVGTVFISVLDKNDPPVTTNKTLNTDEDIPVSISIDDLIAGDTVGPADEQLIQTLSFSGLINPTAQGGRVEIVGDRVVYYPPSHFNGVDTFRYLVTDDGLSNGQPDPQTSQGTVTINVAPVNDPPFVLKPFGTVTVLEDSLEKEYVLSQFFGDPDIVTNGDVLTYRIASNSNTGLVEPTFAGGKMFVRPKADQNGQATIVVEAMDLAGLKTTNTLRLIVTPVDDDPRLVSPLPDRTISEDSLPLVFDLSPGFFFDPDVINGDFLTFTATSSNTNVATVSIQGNKIQLTLVPNASGQTTITVVATDTTSRFVSDSFILTVSPVNDAPVALPDSYATPQGITLVTTDPLGTLTATTLDDGVLANDRDPEGDAMTASIVSLPTRGTVTLNPNGTFTYTPGPTALFGSTDTFTYRAIDAFGAASPQTTVTITIGRAPAPAYQNPSQRWDVNADGFISPIDVLILVNLLNSRGSSIPVAGLPGPPDYVDVNGDNFVTPLDVLAVVDKINSMSGSGEGEQIVGINTAPRIDSMVVEVGRGLGSSTQMPAWAAMMGTRNSNAAKIAAMPLASMFANNSWDDDFDDLAGLWASQPKSAGDLNDKNSSIDQALSDLFGE
ncbi:MAG: tandem-95 repeat protein [Planctomycetota bacterium]|nr:tandem-95 repeat protein [Planctomycetota bacterium]